MRYHPEAMAHIDDPANDDDDTTTGALSELRAEAKTWEQTRNHNQSRTLGAQSQRTTENAAVVRCVKSWKKVPSLTLGCIIRVRI